MKYISGMLNITLEFWEEKSLTRTSTSCRSSANPTRDFREVITALGDGSFGCSPLNFWGNHTSFIRRLSREILPAAGPSHRARQWAILFPQLSPMAPPEVLRDLIGQPGGNSQTKTLEESFQKAPTPRRLLLTRDIYHFWKACGCVSPTSYAWCKSRGIQPTSDSQNIVRCLSTAVRKGKSPLRCPTRCRAGWHQSPPARPCSRALRHAPPRPLCWGLPRSARTLLPRSNFL